MLVGAAAESWGVPAASLTEIVFNRILRDDVDDADLGAGHRLAMRAPADGVAHIRRAGR